MRIQHNIMAMNAYRNYTNNVSAMKKNLEKLSSGYKINRAGDDAAGLAISEKMRAQITGLETAQKNAKDGISLVQTAEGALTEVHDMLNRMVELATQSANGTYDNTTDRFQMQKEVDQLLSEINRIADSSNFNGINLLDGTLGLNTDAFKIGNTVDAQAAEVIANGATIPATAAPALNRPSGTVLHETGQSAQKGEFIIDLSQLSASIKSAGSIKVKIGAAEVILTAAASQVGKTWSAADIVTKLKTALSKGVIVTSGGTIAKMAAAATTGHKGGLIYTVADGDKAGTLKFTTAKYVDSSKAVQNLTSAGKPVKGVATGALKAPNWSVTVTATTPAKIQIGSSNGVNTQNIMTTPVSKPEIDSPDRLASTILSLDMTKIKDGTQLVMDGKTYTFAVGSDSAYKTVTDGSTVIDLTAETSGKETLSEVTDADDKAVIMGKIANALNSSAHFSVGNDITTTGGDYGKLSVFERANPTTGKSVLDPTDADDKALLDKLSTSKATFESLFKLQNQPTAVGTELTLKNAAKIKEGNTLSVDGVKFVFTKEDGKTDVMDPDTNKVTTKYVKIDETGSNAMAQLQAALKAAGYESKVDDTDTTKLTIYGAKTDDDGNTLAPQILGKGLTLQIGDTSDDFNQLNVAVQDMHAVSLGIKGLKINAEESAQQAIKKIKDAINTVSDVRGTLGATQNRLDHTINNLSVMTENIQDAESTIRDVDVAEEMMAYTKNNILIQSAQAMLAQANQVPQGVLQLLQ